MQSRSIIHDDVKWSNVLYVKDSNSICDLGLSSIVKYAKVEVCAMEYAPAPGDDFSNTDKSIGREIIALCISRCFAVLTLTGVCRKRLETSYI